MDKPNYLVKLALSILAFIWQIQAQWIPRPFEPRPLCVSQYALANHACSLLPFEPNPPPTPPPSPSPSPKSPPPKSPPPKSPPPKSPPPMSPLSPPPPFHKGMPPPPPHHKHLPPPPSAPGPPPPHHKGMPPPPPHHKHTPPPPTNQIRVSESGHRHGHRSHHGGGSPIEKECCKWLEQLDRECVCDLLVYLPVFLSKPVHIYTLKVGHACTVSYSCGSRIIGAESHNVTGTESKNVTRIY